MRVVIQKVKRAAVTVDSAVVSSIQKGLMVLVGISTSDTMADVEKLLKKIVGLRLFEDLSIAPETATKWYGKPWSKSLNDDLALEILCVSQFTLYGTVKKGSKPDFHRAARGQEARQLYDSFLDQLRGSLGNERVKDGEFGAMMDVELVNDGPVTIVWDTQKTDL